MKTNQVSITGFTGKAIEIGTINEKPMARLSVAVNDRFKTAEGWKSRTNWFTVTVWNTKLIESIKEIAAGAKVTIDGALRSSSSNGKYFVDIIASKIQMAE